MESSFYDDMDKLVVINYCKKFIKGNGYIRLGWAVEQSIKEKKYDGNGHRIAFLNSVSAMLVNTGEYVREENKEIDGDYDILLNPHFFLNKSVKNISKITAFIAGIALLISGIGLYKQINSSDGSPTPVLRQIDTTLQRQHILIINLEHRLKNIDSSFFKFLQESSNKK